MTENHPDVQTMKLSAADDSKHMAPSPHGLYAEVVKTRIKEVCQKSETGLLNLHKLFDPDKLPAYSHLHYINTPLIFVIPNHFPLEF